LKFKELGWNGFLLEIPEEMRLTSEGGNIKSGYLKLEMEGFLIEVRWDPFEAKKAKPLAEIANSFIKDFKKKLEKKSKKKIDLKVESMGSTLIASHNAYSMNIKSGAEKELVYIWTCENSKRIIIAHLVSLLPKEKSKEVITHTLNSFRCHLDEELIPWIALNLRFRIPSSFLLSERRIAAGRAYLMFNEQQFSTFTERGRKLLIEYFSMANLIFEDSYKNPEKWFQEKYRKDLKKRLKNITFRTTEAKRFMRHKAVYRHGVKNSGFLSRRKTVSENLTWYCSKTNRIYSITYVSYINRPLFLKRELNEEEDRKIMQNFLSSFKCHY